jgi:trimethyllysine dioxygenase
MATRLYKDDPDAYTILSSINLFAHASGNDGVSIQPARAFPVLNHAHERLSHLMQVRWNTADRAGIDVPLGPKMERWYDAAA